MPFRSTPLVAQSVGGTAPSVVGVQGAACRAKRYPLDVNARGKRGGLSQFSHATGHHAQHGRCDREWDCPLRRSSTAEDRFMPELEFSQAAQHWAIVVLVWVGFGSLAGLLARLVLPVREPSGPLPTLAVGIAGSALGLAVLSWTLGDRPLNPVSPLGFLAAAAGAAVLLVLYQIIRAGRPKPDPNRRHGDEAE